MMVRRAATLTTVVVALSLFVLSPAWAGNYPPGGTGGTGVGGVQSGPLGGSGSGLVGGTGAGLANTGFDLTMLWMGLAVLALGVALLAATRRLREPDDA